MADETKQVEQSETKENKKGAKKDNRVEVFIPRGNVGDDPNYFVSVNGVNYLLPRGKTSLVPPHIKAEIERSFAAEAKMNDNIDKLIEASK